jgi:hypothetical protein
VPPPSPGTVARTVFPAQAPHVVAREVRAVEHMLLTAGHWLVTVDVSSVLLHEQQGLFALAAAAFAVANDRFPAALPHEPSCPLSHEADMMLPPSPLGGGARITHWEWGSSWVTPRVNFHTLHLHLSTPHLS